MDDGFSTLAYRLGLCVLLAGAAYLAYTLTFGQLRQAADNHKVVMPPIKYEPMPDYIGMEQKRYNQQMANFLK